MGFTDRLCDDQGYFGEGRVVGGRCGVGALASRGLAVMKTTNVVNSGVTRATVVVKLASGVYLCSPCTPNLRKITRRLFRYNFRNIGVAFASSVGRTLANTGCVMGSNKTTHGTKVAHRSLLGKGTTVTRRFNGGMGTCYPSIGRVMIVFGPTSVANLVALLCSNLGPSRIAALTTLSSAHLHDRLTGRFNMSVSIMRGYHACNNRNRRVTICTSATGIRNGPLTNVVNASTLAGSQ